MAELNNSGSGQWSETDASNTSPSPDGWPAGTFFNQVEPIGQSTMGAIKRFWDRINGTVTTTGAAGTYTYTPVNTSFPTALKQGETYSFKADKDSAGNDVININVLGAKKMYKMTSTGATQISAGDIKTSAHIVGQIDTSLDTGAGGYLITAGLVTGATNPFSDDTALIKNSVDPTKLAIISAASITTGTTRTYTLPDATTALVGLATTQTLSNKSLSDATTFIVDSLDTTKKVQFEVSGVTTGTTRTLTVPDASGTLVLTSSVPFTKSFTSSQQTITSGGSLTIAHSMATTPTLLVCKLIAQNSVLGYTAGDIYFINPSMGQGVNTGVSVVPDATNLNIRFGSDTQAFGVVRKDTGASAGTTNTDWKIIFAVFA